MDASWEKKAREVIQDIPAAAMMMEAEVMTTPGGEGWKDEKGKGARSLGLMIRSEASMTLRRLDQRTQYLLPVTRRNFREQNNGEFPCLLSSPDAGKAWTADWIRPSMLDALPGSAVQSCITY